MITRSKQSWEVGSTVKVGRSARAALQGRVLPLHSAQRHRALLKPRRSQDASVREPAMHNDPYRFSPQMCALIATGLLVVIAAYCATLI
jgi:hypothetical protein